MYQFLLSGFLCAGLYCTREKENHQTLSRDRKFVTKEQHLGLSGAICNEKLSFYSICCFLQVFLTVFGLFLYIFIYFFMTSSFITTYLRYMTVVILIDIIGYIKWRLKPPCQTRKSVRTDFHIW